MEGGVVHFQGQAGGEGEERKPCASSKPYKIL